MTLWIALRNLRVRAPSTALTVAVVAVATAAALAVPLVLRQVDRAASDAVEVYDLLVTAKGGEEQAVLSTLFFAQAPIGNIPYAVHAVLRADPRVVRSVPFGLGDSFRGHPVVGTSTEWFDLRVRAGDPPYGRIAEGRVFAGPFEAVLGADVARRHGITPGATITTTHGRFDLGVDAVGASHDHDHDHDHDDEHGHDDEHAHDDPLTDALAALAAAHDALAAARDEAERATRSDAVARAVAAVTALAAPASAPPSGVLHAHGEAYRVVGVLAPTGGPIDGAVLVDIESVWLVHGQTTPASRTVTALAVTARVPADYVALARELDARPDAQAVFIGAVFGQLRGWVARGQGAYEALRWLVLAMASATVWLNLYADARERRRLDARLRTLGAVPRLRFAVVLVEAGVTVGAGLVLGVALAFGGAWLAAGPAATVLGVRLPAPVPDASLLVTVLPLFAFGIAAALVPAVRAARIGAVESL